MKELSERLVAGAKITTQYFRSKLNKDGSYGENIDDLSCYYKSPMMFIIAGQKDLANLVLDHIKCRYMTDTGDFMTDMSMKSAKPEYTIFWTYTNGWIVRAAIELGRKDISISAYEYLLHYNVENGLGFLMNHLDSKNGVTDVLTAAHHGLIHLEHNNMDLAVLAGNYLCAALHKQPEIDRFFYLRFDASGNAITQFDDEQVAFFCIDKQIPDQLYFMIGYPCAYLALLHEKTKDKKFIEGAKAYLNFALSCDENVLSCNFSHKLAWAASILYKITGDAKYLTSITTITDYFISRQSREGMWYLEDDINTAYDQSAEIACWFMDIVKNLQ
ncbi:MAG: hypothetical protein V3V61_00575 [Gammaproteobacteria bacterium]